MHRRIIIATSLLALVAGSIACSSSDDAPSGQPTGTTITIEIPSGQLQAPLNITDPTGPAGPTGPPES